MNLSGSSKREVDPFSVYAKMSRLCIIYRPRPFYTRLWRCQRGGKRQKMVLRVCVHISGKKAYLCTIRILPESSTFAGYNNTQHEHELGLFQDLWTVKRLPIRKKVRYFCISWTNWCPRSEAWYFSSATTSIEQIEWKIKFGVNRPRNGWDTGQSI